MFAILMQGLTTFIVVLVWRKNLALHGERQITLLASAAQVGINSIGKYAPGKVFGSLARGIAVYNKTGNSKAAIQASFYEQLALLHSGLAIAALTFVYDRYPPFLLTLTLLIIFFSTLSIQYITRFFQWSLQKMFAKLSFLQYIHEQEDTGRYIIIFLMLTLIWILASWTLFFCVFSLTDVKNFSFTDALSITIFSYLGGFIAIFSPGGLGIREGIMTAFLTPVTGLSIAISISALHRIITLFFDILLGGLSMRINSKS